MSVCGIADDVNGGGGGTMIFDTQRVGRKTRNIFGMSRQQIFYFFPGEAAHTLFDNR